VINMKTKEEHEKHEAQKPETVTKSAPKLVSEPEVPKDAPELVSEPEVPQADPVLMRQQQLKERYRQITERTMELRQQKTLVEDMITDATIQAAELRGAMNEIDRNQKG